MKFTSFMKGAAVKRVGALSLALALGAGLVGCGGDGAGSGAVAATVNGQDIMEQTVTDYVADFRQSASLESDEAWGQWLVANSYTPESVREEVIDYYVNQDLYEQAAAEYNVTVEQADIDEALEQTKAMFESEEAFQQALEASNMTEESYVETVIQPNLLQTKLAEAVAAADSSDENGDASLQAAQEMADQWNGSKRSSHILFSADDEAKAQEVLDQINAGEIDFAEAAKQYSTDTGSAENGGDVGWDALNSFVTEYQEALNGLETDQVSTLVKSDYGYHIIKCTDTFTVPEGGITSIDQLPAEFQDYITYMEQNNASSNFTTWFAEYRENAEITITPMPEGLPYDIDLAPYEEQAAQDEAAATDANVDTDATTTEGDAAAEGDAATTEGEAAEGDAATAEGDQAAAEGDQAAAEGDAAQGEQGDQAAAEGDAAEGDQAATEGDQAAEGEQTQE
ncbi:peptidylprolyl isomerase [Adlercreutzia equolifaciens]|uniref:peptidylprolyl isomerase n=1 Tax=Adlercreutzia equolifaciens TaxID=446660 RepID=UPI0023AF0B0B|nr:peptidylprolyl isomerase [Adlercreutzia equolifaciens]MDE8701443.1 peptidylprolyl isomerase [Adlercreutzia equolifaciens]